MVTASEAAEEYRAVLTDLTRNDKTQINLLTILAEDYASYSNEIVKVIEETLYNCPNILKIVILYVIDSIIKNIPVTGGYRDLFAKNIVDMIVHVFRENNEKTRASIYRLRCTWEGIFPNARLYMIDMKLNAIDKAWPIQNPKERQIEALTIPVQTGHVVHVNPRFLNGRAATATTSQQPIIIESSKSKNDKVDGMKKERQSPKLKSDGVKKERQSPKLKNDDIKKERQSPKLKNDDIKKERQSPTPKSDSAKKEQPQSPTSKSDSVKKEQLQSPTPKSVDIKREQRQTPTPKSDSAKKEQPQSPTSKSDSAKKRQSPKPKTEGLEQQQRKRMDEPIMKKAKMNFFGRIPKKSATTSAEKLQPQQSKKDTLKPKSLLTLRVVPPMIGSSQQQIQQQQQHPKATVVLQLKRSRQPSQSQQQHGFSHQKTKSTLPEPTAAPGAHAFGHNILTATVPAAVDTSTLPNACVMEPITNTVIPDVPEPLQFQTQPQCQSVPHQLESTVLQQSAQTQQQQQPPPFMDSAPPPTSLVQSQNFPVPPQHNIQNVTPRLPGVPENNRIFVDGKAYEVFYLDDVAVIERNGLPHRVYFHGPPRDVIIDGVAYRMAFGEHKHVLIDGDLHVLRFGAPSRELYMGNFPFKGAFGGSPIISTINGRRHELRLCGPAPDVRIDPEPSYELMRYMPAVRQQQSQQQPPKIEQKKEPSLDVANLLKRLKNSGVLTQLSEAERKTRERQAVMEAKSAAIGRSDSPPVPCNHRFDHIERRATPMAGLDQFSLRSLIIRYDSIIDAIHQKRKSCQHCGIAFNELYGEAYQRHVDWHLQDTLNMKDPRHKYARSQPWYMLEEWFNYFEADLVNKVSIGENDKATGTDEGKKTASPGQTQVIDGNQDAPSDSIETKECQVCHEQFEEYWDEEDDVWRLRDCVILNGKTFHTYCREDIAVTSTSESIHQGEACEQGEDCDSDMRPDPISTTFESKYEMLRIGEEKEPQQMDVDEDNKITERFYEPISNKHAEGQ